MIEIIKHGSKPKTICEICNCIFSYEKEDTKCEYLGSCCYLTIKCPECSHKNFLETRIK